MASVVNSIMQPEESAIKAHLELLFAPLREEYPRGLIELRYGSANPNNSQYFNLREDGVADAASFADARSRAGDTVYVGVNPRKPDMDRRGSAKDSDVEIAIYQFADIDSADALEGLGRKLRALPPTFTLNTGTTPHRRPHLYWQLEEPVRNMRAWTERQRGIAQSLGGDSVINPSRIMRLAGTVNFPARHKVERGYRVELVTLKTEFDEEREPVSPEEVERAFPIPTGATETVIPSIGDGQSTLSAMRPTRIHDLIEACRSGSEWHNNMIRLVAHLAAIGRTSAEILALADHITLPGYTADQTVREMQTALAGARQKWALPEPAEDPVETEEQAREEADSIFELLDLDEIEQLPPPTWIIDDLLVDDGLSVIYGDPGAGKSFVALDISLRLAYEMDWHGTDARPSGVLYIAGEGKSGIGNRIKGWRKEHGMEGVEAPFLLLPTAVEIANDKQRTKLLRTIDASMERARFPIGLIVVDTVSRALAGGDENGSDAMGQFVAACDAIKRHAGGALLGVHHSGKDKEKGMRGSTVLLGACDATIKVTKEGDLVTLVNEKQKDAEEAAPIYLKMKKLEWAEGLEKEQSTLVPFRSEAAAPISSEILDKQTIYEILSLIDERWQAEKPLSPHPQAKRSGTYAPIIVSRKFSISRKVASEYLDDWLANGVLLYDEISSRSKAKGLRVIDWIMP